MRACYDPVGQGDAFVWEEDDDIRFGNSYDDGRTLEDGSVIFEDCTRPHVVSTPDGFLIASALNAAGKITGRIKGPGDSAWGTAFIFEDETATEMEFEDDSYCFSVQFDPAQRLVLTARLAGSADVDDWFSTDLGRSWTPA